MSEAANKQTIIGHLEELRNRLIKSVIALVITTSLSFMFYQQIFDILTSRAPDVEFIFIEMTEMLGTIMRVCLVSGIILAMPFLTYQLIMFISPALTPKEKRYVYLILPWMTLMFAAGVAFSYYVLIPRMVEFLVSFGGDIATPQIKIGNYIAVVTRLMLAVGLVFELPVLTTLLARLGIVTPKWLADKRRAAIILAFVAAAMITPTIDPINQSLVALPLIVLYEMSIWLAKLVSRKKKAPPETGTDDSEQ
ncbi:MAG: twin-arginine translocase subunit TatC [Dehalococcoidales bacterium]|nr:twin-arginine translocase subunit TatC [Dehalococcoidales bacterium]